MRLRPAVSALHQGFHDVGAHARCVCRPRVIRPAHMLSLSKGVFSLHSPPTPSLAPLRLRVDARVQRCGGDRFAAHLVCGGGWPRGSAPRFSLKRQTEMQGSEEGSRSEDWAGDSEEEGDVEGEGEGEGKGQGRGGGASEGQGEGEGKAKLLAGSGASGTTRPLSASMGGSSAGGLVFFRVGDVLLLCTYSVARAG